MVRSAPPLLAVFPPPCSALARLRASVSPDGERSVTPVHAVGVDLSAGMLRHGAPRLPAGRADASRLPVRDESVPAVLAAMVHTDMPAYRHASHWPLPELPGMFTAAGLTLDRFAEGGRPTPTVLGVRAVKG
jgi:hypothetical protein